jgi:hypothetical protein
VYPSIHLEQPGLPEESSSGEEGVNYLRRIRVSVAKDVTPSTPAKVDGKAKAVAVAAEFKERRQSVRIRCSGSVEFRAEGRPDRLWGTLTDISLHGCYVEMHTTFPVGTKVDLILKSFGVQIHTSGVVRVSYPFLGMGIGFAEIEAGQQEQLKHLLDALSGHGAVSTTLSAPENITKDILATVDQRALLHGIWDFFEKHQWLSREEFLELAKQRRRL